jgi:transcriptional regulator with XRE-family HTH domain
LKNLFKDFSLTYGAEVATFADRLKELLAEQRPPMSQHKLAKLAKVTQPAITGWMNGAVPYPSTVNLLCAIFGVRRDWLLYGEGKKHLPKSALRNVAREGDSEYGALLQKVTFIAQSDDEDLKAQVDAFLDLACRQLGMPRDKKPDTSNQS